MRPPESIAWSDNEEIRRKLDGEILPKVTYSAQVMHKRTMEQQAMLLAYAARCVWDDWTQRDDDDYDQERVDNHMRALYREISDMDIFMSGVAAGRNETFMAAKERWGK